MTTSESEQAKDAAFRELMRSNQRAVHVRVAPSFMDLCEVYHCDRLAVERCGRRDGRLCAVHLKADLAGSDAAIYQNVIKEGTGCKATHRTLDGAVVHRRARTR